MNLTSVSINSSWRPPEEADPERPWGGHYRNLNYVPWYARMPFEERMGPPFPTAPRSKNSCILTAQ